VTQEGPDTKRQGQSQKAGHEVHPEQTISSGFISSHVSHACHGSPAGSDAPDRYPPKAVLTPHYGRPTARAAIGAVITVPPNDHAIIPHTALDAPIPPIEIHTNATRADANALGRGSACTQDHQGQHQSEFLHGKSPQEWGTPTVTKPKHLMSSTAGKSPDRLS
jgi:hypothetical protein